MGIEPTTIVSQSTFTVWCFTTALLWRKFNKLLSLSKNVIFFYWNYKENIFTILVSAIARAVDEWKRNKEQNNDQDMPEEENIYPEDVCVHYLIWHNLINSINQQLTKM